MAAKRMIEIFSAGCPACEETVTLINRMACPSCDVTVLDMHNPEVARRAKSLGIRTVPAVVINGTLAAWSRTCWLRIMFRDLSRSVCVVSNSRLSGLKLDFQPFVEPSLPACRHACPIPFYDRFPDQSVTGLGVEATAAL